jgi:hypothetical protein
MTDEQIDALLRALTVEGFELPYGARSSDYPDDAELRTADQQAHQQNRAALRRALVPEKQPNG